jgi:ribonuclease P protein component
VRLTRRPQFLFVAAGLVERRKGVLIQARRVSDLATIGAGFTATKKIGGAVIRNRAKRRLREAARALLPRLGLPGVDYVFIARQETGDRVWAALLDDVESALISLARKLDGGPRPSTLTPLPPGGPFPHGTE